MNGIEPYKLQIRLWRLEFMAEAEASHCLLIIRTLWAKQFLKMSSDPTASSYKIPTEFYNQGSPSENA